MAKFFYKYEACTGFNFPTDCFKDDCSIGFASSASNIKNNGEVFVSTIGFPDNPITLIDQTEIAQFELFKGRQADKLIEIDFNLILLATKRNPDSSEGKLNQLIQDLHFQKIATRTVRPPTDFSKLWFPIPETCIDFSNV